MQHRLAAAAILTLTLERHDTELNTETFKTEPPAQTRDLRPSLVGRSWPPLQSHLVQDSMAEAVRADRKTLLMTRLYLCYSNTPFKRLPLYFTYIMASLSPTLLITLCPSTCM